MVVSFIGGGKQKVLNVESEMEVYYALERWLDSDIKNRLQYSKELSQYIHFEDLLNQFDELPKLKYLNLSKDDISERMKNGMKLRGRKVNNVKMYHYYMNVKMYHHYMYVKMYHHYMNFKMYHHYM
jgi:hypothetical protein